MDNQAIRIWSHSLRQVLHAPDIGGHPRYLCQDTMHATHNGHCSNRHTNTQDRRSLSFGEKSIAYSSPNCTTIEATITYKLVTQARAELMLVPTPTCKEPQAVQPARPAAPVSQDHGGADQTASRNQHQIQR